MCCRPSVCLPPRVGHERAASRFSRQQTVFAKQTVHGLSATHELAQGLGAQLGSGQILFGALSSRGRSCSALTGGAPMIIHWFRSDLRLHDNRALALSAAQADELLCIYLHDPRHDETTRWGFSRMGDHRRIFLADALLDLDRALRARGQRLHVIKSRPREWLSALGPGVRVVCERIAAPEEADEIEVLRVAGVDVKEIWQSSLLEPEDLPFTAEVLPKIFTDFRRRVEKAGVTPHAPLPAIEHLPPPPAADFAAVAESIDAVLGVARVPLDRRTSFPYDSAACRGGESAALDHVRRYFSSRLPQTYKQTRNGLVGMDYSTKFSPWLASGALSPRTVYAALRAHENEYGANEDTYWIWFELLWRDHFRLLHLQHGRRLYHPAGLSSLPPPRHDPQAFESWRAGQTGEAFIDAAMRELAATGYLSNRMRQNAASWLINDLQGDFRAGAAWFERQLIDYDPYSNQGNWLYLAGRGTDPRTGRRFDPGKQAQDYDPKGAYRALWNTAG